MRPDGNENPKAQESLKAVQSTKAEDGKSTQYNMPEDAKGPECEN